MLDSKLRSLQRKSLDEETKNSQLLKLNKRNKDYMKKQKFTYSVTLVLFGLLLFVFSQIIIEFPKSIQPQQSTNFELGEVTKAYYLYSKRADRMYNLTSPFYTDKLSTTDPAILNEFELLFKNSEWSSFSGELTNYTDSTNYLFQLENGGSVYLKEINDDGNSFFVNPNTMMQIKLPEQSHEQFHTYWLHIYIGKNDFPPWKIGLLTILLLLFVYAAIKSKRRGVKEKTSPIINLTCLVLTFISIHQMNEWIGVNHLLMLLLIFTFFISATIYLHILIKKQQPNWKHDIQRIFMINVILFVLFI
ncbi:hypothetical protein H9635_00100 [Solibacillus sp. A46]|uniref:Uncharacterized protein n=1 Tax=Solibacillus faecavium TaxID=2762221 RepID=A0ABR8XT73_9BACL|nr:hypothetical protein [Solibacillus faecavium]MBD8035117.1 hypothetical protein [Solibacillus faecavium]